MKEILACGWILFVLIFVTLTSSVSTRRTTRDTNLTSSVSSRRTTEDTNLPPRKLWKPPLIHRILVRTGNHHLRNWTQSHYNKISSNRVTVSESKNVTHHPQNVSVATTTISPKLGKSHKDQTKNKKRNRYFISDVKGNMNKGSYRNRFSQRNRSGKRNRNGDRHQSKPKYRNHQTSQRGRNRSKNHKSQQRGQHTGSHRKHHHRPRGRHGHRTSHRKGIHNRTSHRKGTQYRTSHRNRNSKGNSRNLHGKINFLKPIKFGKYNETVTIKDLRIKGGNLTTKVSPGSRKHSASNSSVDETGALELRSLIADALCDFCRTIKSKRCRKKYCIGT